MNKPAATRDYVSIGALAADLQRPVRSIEAVATRLGIAPAMRLNRVVHFDASQVARITGAFRLKLVNIPAENKQC